MSKRPILRGFVVGRQLIVFCPNCDAWHIHGWDPAHGARHVEHRVSHCHGGLFDTTGYYIAPFKKADLEAAGVVSPVAAAAKAGAEA